MTGLGAGGERLQQRRQLRLPTVRQTGRSEALRLLPLEAHPDGIQTPDPLLRRYVVPKSKCRFWCRSRGSVSLISPLNWTDVGLNA
jgi:hypothetical protein